MATTPNLRLHSDTFAIATQHFGPTRTLTSSLLFLRACFQLVSDKKITPVVPHREAATAAAAAAAAAAAKKCIRARFRYEAVCMLMFARRG